MSAINGIKFTGQITGQLISQQVAKTPREVRLDRLLAACLPVIIMAELGPSTSPELRRIIEKIKEEL